MEIRSLIEENEKDVLDAIKCRQIVKEIFDFGINQNQLKTLIKFLALELEDREAMLAIRRIFKDEDSNFENKPSIQI